MTKRGRYGKTVSKKSADDLPPWEPLKVAAGKETSEKRGPSALSTAPEVPPPWWTLSLSCSFVNIRRSTRTMVSFRGAKDWQPLALSFFALMSSYVGGTPVVINNLAVNNLSSVDIVRHAFPYCSRHSHDEPLSAFSSCSVVLPHACVWIWTESA